MNIESFREYCLAKKGVTEEFPFDNDTLVFKVMGKIFALTSLTFSPFRVNLKMDPTLAPEYRERYEDVIPGYHMNKKLWNSVYFDSGTIPRKELLWMVDHSYEQVVAGLTKKVRNELEMLYFRSMELILLGILSFGIYKMAMSYQIMPWKWVMRLVVTFVASYIAFCIAIVMIYGQALQKDANKIVEVVTPLMPFVLLYEMLLFFFFRSQMLRYVHALDQIDKNNNNNNNNTPPSSPTPPQQEPKDLSYFR